MTYHAEYCICGGEMTIEGAPSFVDAVVAIWRNAHSGKGHGPATAKEARQVRQESEDKETQS